MIALFLDIEKAYDKTWRWGVLKKLENIGLMGHIAKFIEKFLTNRKITVLIGNIKS